MAYVNQLLRSKGSATWTVTPETTVFDALALMAEKGIGAVLVMVTVDVVQSIRGTDDEQKENND